MNNSAILRILYYSSMHILSSDTKGSWLMARFWSRWQRGVEFILIGSDKEALTSMSSFLDSPKDDKYSKENPLTFINLFAWICLWCIMQIVQSRTLQNDYNIAFPHFQCKFYGRGQCFKGSACTFRHEQTDKSKERWQWWGWVWWWNCSTSLCYISLFLWCWNIA